MTGYIRKAGPVVPANVAPEDPTNVGWVLRGKPVQIPCTGNHKVVTRV